MIREVREEDLDGLLELYLHLHETEIPVHDEHLKKTWQTIINDPNYHIVVCEEDGKLISSCVCLVVPNLTRNVRPYVLIENVVTHRDYRGKGYATKCLEYSKKIAVENNCYKMMLMTGSKNSSTLKFYENAGYSSSDKTAFNLKLQEVHFDYR